MSEERTVDQTVKCTKTIREEIIDINKPRGELIGLSTSRVCVCIISSMYTFFFNINF